jgi:cellulose synthase/poly-beta-1,6-N-acetylglucosamine synthase-like glycosyltransferase
MATWLNRAGQPRPDPAGDTWPLGPASGLPAEMSARGGVTPAQKRIGLGLLAMAGALFLLADEPLRMLALAMTPVCLLACVIHLGAALEPLPPAPAASAGEETNWPFYTVLVPLYREARVVPQLLAALRALDYPRDRLQIVLLLEADDEATLAAVLATPLRPFERALIVPPGEPRTKPRALNAGLREARPGLLVVFDAEDIPAPDQLRKAAGIFAGAGRTLACLQARLDIDNREGTALAALFALEYLALFHAVKPGLAADHLPVPLGGTSNHFRTEALLAIGGWDDWNVTEDADLGIRLARAGYRVGDLVSSTAEEAPLHLKPWLRQRRRWLKGWIQTALVHSRDPRRTLADLGWFRTVCAIGAVPAPYLSALVYPVFSAIFLFRLLTGEMLVAEGLVDAFMKGLMWVVFVSGLAASTVPAVIGARRAGARPPLALYALQPFYAVLVSLAAWLALWDFIRRPFHWWKTEHGLARRPGRAVSEAGDDGLEQRAGEDPLAPADPEQQGGERREGDAGDHEDSRRRA